MYYLAKGLQFAGLLIVGIGFLNTFPDLMDPRPFVGGMALCATGWIMQHYLLKR